jgi:hypothetical protein
MKNPDYNGFGGGMYSNDFSMLSLYEKGCWTIISMGAIVKRVGNIDGLILAPSMPITIKTACYIIESKSSYLFANAFLSYIGTYIPLLGTLNKNVTS